MVLVATSACSDGSVAEAKPPVSGDHNSIDLWQLADVKERPFSSANTDDAYIVDAFNLHRSSEASPINLLRTGWEDGWIFYTHHDQEWLRVGKEKITFKSPFDYGEFTGNAAPDLLLYVNRDDDVPQINPPDMPRLFEWDGRQFSEISLSCAPALQSLFLSKITRYKHELGGEQIPGGDDALKGEIVQEEMQRLTENCNR